MILLDPIHIGIRHFYQFFQCDVLIAFILCPGINGDPDAGLNGLLQKSLLNLRTERKSCFLGPTGIKRKEFISSKAADHCLSRQAFHHDLCNFLQYIISVAVSKPVIYLLEAVCIKKHDSDALLPTPPLKRRCNHLLISSSCINSAAY